MFDRLSLNLFRNRELASSSCSSLTMFRLLLRLSLVSLVASLISHHGLLFPKRRSLISLSLFENNNEKYSDQSGKPDSPSRFDTCLLLTDGIIGMEPKDVYLKNGHHVMNFPVSLLLGLLFFIVGVIVYHHELDGIRWTL